MFRKISCLLAAGIFAGGAFAAPLNINFDGSQTDQGLTQPGLSGFSIQGAHWSGGVISETPAVLRASGKTAYTVSGAPGQIVFDHPVMNVEFFFVHGQDVPAGMATAYNADGRILDTVRSRPASHFGDSRNFVRFDTKQPISAVVFSGGSIDSFRAEAYEPDYFLVEGHSWVNDDIGENNAAGIFFDYLSSTNTLFMAWYTYDSAEKTAGAFDGDVGAADNRWLTAKFDVQQGESTVVGTLYASTGGVFNQARTAVQETVEVGVITLDFIDCDRALISYELQDPAISGSFAIIPTEKQVNPSGFVCDPRDALVEVFQRDLSQVDADIEVAIRAAYDAENVALQFSWNTNKNYFGLVRALRVLNAEGNWAGPAESVEEDRVAVIFGVKGSVESEHFGCFQSCHSDMNRMPEATVDARHYVIPADAEALGTYQSDMWHWRGSRAGPMGYAEDTWVRAHEFGTGAQGRRRDATGPDGRLRENQGFGTEYTAMVNGESVTIKLPEFVFDPELNSGFYFFTDGTRLITEETLGNVFNSQTFAAMAAGERQHALIVNGPLVNALEVAELSQTQIDAIATQALAGGMILQPYLQDDLSGESDQHDIRSTREFANGQVTVTMIRARNTGSEFDVDLSDLASSIHAFGVAVHDSNSGGLSHHVSVPMTLGAEGTVVPVAVDSVNGVDWTSIEAFTTTTFKPQHMSYQWLTDVPNGHPVEVDRDCASCHSLASEEHPFGLETPPGSCLGCHANGTRAAKLYEYAPLNLVD